MLKNNPKQQKNSKLTEVNERGWKKNVTKMLYFIKTESEYPAFIENYLKPFKILL